MIVNSKLEIL